MKAWSLWQPWASAWLSPIKTHETRHWELKHRGPLLVHAAKKIVHGELEPELSAALVKQFGVNWLAKLPRGMLIGVVIVLDCKRVETLPPEHRETDDYHAGNYSPDRFAIERSPEFQVFKNPIAYRGQQSLFEVPDEVVREALAA